MDLDDLNIKSLEDMSLAEALEYLRHIRLRRRVSEKPRPTRKTDKKPSKSADNLVDKLQKDQIEKLLSLIGGTND